MNLCPKLAIKTALCVAAAAPSPAQDVRVTATGTVQSVWAGGTGSGPLAGAAASDPFTLIFDVEVPSSPQAGVSIAQLNWPSSSLTIGAASDGFGFHLGQLARLVDDGVLEGDELFMQTRLRTAPSTDCQLLVSDPTGQAWATNDWSALVGTQLQTSALDTHLAVWTAQGAVTCALDSLRFDAAPGGSLGTAYCVAEPNSTGAAGSLSAYGLVAASGNDLTLRASQLPQHTVAYFLVSASQGFVALPGGSQGNLCLSGPIGRLVGAGQVQPTGSAGQVAVPIDLTHLPTPTGSHAVQPGETWNFQLWHRDTSLGSATSNFTEALAVAFQ